MGKVIDLTGRKFTRWTVQKLSHQVGKMLYWDCVCDCGERRAVFGGDLKRGGSRSCGCLMREERASRATTHGMSNTPAHRTWTHMKSRCSDTNNDGHYLYGARGIEVCDQWQTFEGFWEDMGPTWAPGLSIDRIDNDKGYSPDNCRWQTPRQQANNRRTNVTIQTPKGPMNIAQAAAAFGLPWQTIYSRIRYGWPEERLCDPVGFRRRKD